METLGRQGRLPVDRRVGRHYGDAWLVMVALTNAWGPTKDALPDRGFDGPGVWVLFLDLAARHGRVRQVSNRRLGGVPRCQPGGIGNEGMVPPRRIQLRCVRGLGLRVLGFVPLAKGAVMVKLFSSQRQKSSVVPSSGAKPSSTRAGQSAALMSQKRHS